MRLNDVQGKFKHMMFQPIRALEDCEEDFKAVFREDGIAFHERLKVYHSNVIGSLTAALAATFPVVENLVGADFFKVMARGFIFDNPPDRGCLQFYGAGFDGFIRAYAPAAGLAYLPDVARFEFALNVAYYAPDDDVLAPDALASLPPENLGDSVLHLRPSATLIESRYPLLQIRDFCLDEDHNAPPNLDKDHGCRLLIVRPQLDVDIVVLREDEFMVLSLLQEETPLGAAVERTLEQFSDFDFTAFLQKHIALETFSALGGYDVGLYKVES